MMDVKFIVAVGILTALFLSLLIPEREPECITDLECMIMHGGDGHIG